ncbi:MAG: permease-like cell division protein FtsX [Bacteroidetes bacterium]|nr:permease-like cell division protein FtsX [Bacteroidota bacterium]
MNLKYLIKEGFSGFQKARFNVLASIFSIALALILIGGYFIIQTNINNIVTMLRDKVELEVFINDAETDYLKIENLISKINGVNKVTFISKNEAANIFKNEFGEEINSVLEFNPLPASFRVSLKNDYKKSKSASLISSQIQLIQGVEKVIYRKKLLEYIDSRSKLLTTISLGIGGILLFVSFGFVVNTIRLAISAKRKTIETMKLVGATNSFIRLPFIIEGIFQGILGSTIALGVIILGLYLFSEFVTRELKEIIFLPTSFISILYSLGIILGWLGSFIGVRRFLK